MMVRIVITQQKVIVLLLMDFIAYKFNLKIYKDLTAGQMMVQLAQPMEYLTAIIQVDNIAMLPIILNNHTLIVLHLTIQIVLKIMDNIAIINKI